MSHSRPSSTAPPTWTPRWPANARRPSALTDAADAAEAAERARADASQAADLAARAAADAGFRDLDAARQARRPAQWRAAADHRIRDHEARANAVAELLAHPDLDVALDPPADVAGASDAVAAERTAHDEAVTAQGLARGKAEQLAAARPRPRVAKSTRCAPKAPKPTRRAGSRTSRPGRARTRCG